MKKDMVKKNVGNQVLLVPQAYRLDKYGFEVRPVREDAWWIIESVEDEGVTIREPGTGHGRLLGYDHIKSYASDGVKAGVKRGQLLLNVQVTVQGNDVRITPTARPGEPVPHKVPLVHEEEVELSWPDTGGLQKRLSSQGYKLGWTNRARGNGLIANGTHERVMEPDGHGGWTTFRTSDGMILIKYLPR